MTFLSHLWVALVLCGLANCLVFIVAYHVKTRGQWRHYVMGRHLMGFIAALTVPFILQALALTRGPLGPLAWVLALTCVNVALVHRNRLLLVHDWATPSVDSPVDNRDSR